MYETTEVQTIVGKGRIKGALTNTGQFLSFKFWIHAMSTPFKFLNK